MDTIVEVIGMPADIFGGVGPTGVKPANSLMITDLSIVEDPSRTFDICKPAGRQGTPNGVWTIGRLFRQLAQGTNFTPEQYALNWLNTWASNQSINSFNVAARPNVSRIIDSWRNASPNRVLNIDYFPARLTAIVNRPDIGDPIVGSGGGYGGVALGGLKRGEARLVFVLLDKSNIGDLSSTLTSQSVSKSVTEVGSTTGSILPFTSNCSTLPFTVIFEYKTPATSCLSVREWQKRWRELSSLTLGSSVYKNKLQFLTSDFSSFGKDGSQIPNKNLLSQLRTNELASGYRLMPFLLPWEMREFRLQNGPAASYPNAFSNGRLKPTTVNNTPDLSFNNTPTLLSFMQTFNGTVPDNYLGQAFLAGSALVHTTSFHWKAVGTSADKRFNFSSATCNGCHAADTATSFTHIGERGAGQEVLLSRFLTGKPFLASLGNMTFNYDERFTSTDPAFSSVSHKFNDLARRQAALSSAANFQ